MLMNCPECDLQVSDKALQCPHCGYPLTSKPQRIYKKKRRRLPNGFGSIEEIKNKPLRKPFRARICVGKTEYGKPVLQNLKPAAYFETYNEAYLALVEYNKNPYDVDSFITVEELYDRWSKEYFENITDASARTVESAWAYCSELYKMRVVDIRSRHIKAVMDNGKCIVKNGKNKGTVKTPSAHIKARIKSLFNLLLDYALEYEIVTVNYARSFDISDAIRTEQVNATKEHIAFSDKEMEILWANIDLPYVDMILIQCYSGWRPQELCSLLVKNVDVSNWLFIGGMKTKAGTNRVVPIHSKIQDLVLAKYKVAQENDSEYLFNSLESNNISMTYDKYRHRFNSIVNALELNPEHRTHDPRKTFVTMAKNKGVDEYAIKRMVGHEISDLTERVYTERDIKWLRLELEKIK